MNNEMPKRKPTRLKGYDYSSGGAYFVTVCTYNRKCALSNIVGRSRSILSKLIGYIKMNASKEIHRLCGDAEIWQRGFYDHIIRNRDDYQRIAKYIHENPKRWYPDELYAEK